MEELKTLINEKQLHNRIDEIAKQIEQEYKGKELTLICILKGSVFFTVDLAKRINGDVRLEFIRVSSYGEGTESTGEIKMKLDLIDTGRTLSYLIEYLKMKKPKSVKLCTLLDKPERRVKKNVKVDYTGFQIPDKFVVGYGLDCNEKYRNLPYIGYIEN